MSPSSPRRDSPPWRRQGEIRGCPQGPTACSAVHDLAGFRAQPSGQERTAARCISAAGRTCLAEYAPGPSRRRRRHGRPWRRSAAHTAVPSRPCTIPAQRGPGAAGSSITLLGHVDGGRVAYRLRSLSTAPCAPLALTGGGAEPLHVVGCLADRHAAGALRRRHALGPSRPQCCPGVPHGGLTWLGTFTGAAAGGGVQYARQCRSGRLPV